MQHKLLGDLCQIVRGSSPRPKGDPKYYGAGVPRLMVGDLTRDGKNVTPQIDSLTPEGALKSRMMSAGDLVVAVSGQPGRPAILAVDACIHDGFAGLRNIDTKQVNIGYLYHFLNAVRFDLAHSAVGAIFKNLTTDQLKSIDVPLPSLSEQENIASILDKADSLRNHREKALQLTDELLRSVFLDIFGDPIQNPMGWGVNHLGDISEKISSGSTPVGGKKVYVDNGTLFLRSQNVWRRRIELDDVVYIDDATHNKMHKTSLNKGDILITKTGRINTENSSLGRAAIFDGEDGSANINGHVYLVRPKSKINNEFVLYVLTTPEYREYIRSVCVGGIDKRQINKEHLETFPIICPPEDIQNKFIEKMYVIERQKSSMNKQLAVANQLFSALSQKVFGREVPLQKEVA